MIRLLPLILLILSLPSLIVAQDSFHERQRAWDREHDQHSALTDFSRIGREVPAPFISPQQHQQLNAILQGDWSSDLAQAVTSLEEEFAKPLNVYREAATRPLGSRFPNTHFSDTTPNLLAIQATTRVHLATSLREAADGNTGKALEGVIAGAMAGSALQMDGSNLMEAMIGDQLRQLSAKAAGHILAVKPPVSTEILTRYVDTLESLRDQTPHPVTTIRRDLETGGAMMLNAWQEARDNPTGQPIEAMLLQMLEEDPDFDPARDVRILVEFVETHLGGTPPEFFDNIVTWKEDEKKLLEEITALGEPLYSGKNWVGYRHRQIETLAIESLVATAALIQSGVPTEEALARFPDPFTGEALIHEPTPEANPDFRLRAVPPAVAMKGGELVAILERETVADDFIWPFQTAEDTEEP